MVPFFLSESVKAYKNFRKMKYLTVDIFITFNLGLKNIENISSQFLELRLWSNLVLAISDKNVSCSKKKKNNNNKSDDLLINFYWWGT